MYTELYVINKDSATAVVTKTPYGDTIETKY